MSICCRCRMAVEREEDHFYGLHENCFMEWFGLTEPSLFSDIIPRSQSLAPFDYRGKNSSFFHGAFRKYSSWLGNDNYILKVIQKEHPELPATEFLCNQIYECLGIPIPAYYLILYPEHHYCFVTRNFISKLHNASLIHIYHYLERREEYNCEKLVSIIGEKTGRRIEQERFAYLTLADSLIGNHDRHGRNLGFIQTPKGMQLAPFYDNPSYVGLDDDLMLGADLQPRGAIFTRETDEPTLKDYVFEWNRLGYENVVQNFRKNLSLEKLQDLVEKSFTGEKRKKALLRLIKKREAELCVN
jgi:hypothetical protein